MIMDCFKGMTLEEVKTRGHQLIRFVDQLEREKERLHERLADPVELVAEAIYNAEPKPPGPPNPPFGSHVHSQMSWEPYRKKARAVLSVTGGSDDEI